MEDLIEILANIADNRQIRERCIFHYEHCLRRGDSEREAYDSAIVLCYSFNVLNQR